MKPEAINEVAGSAARRKLGEKHVPAENGRLYTRFNDFFPRDNGEHG